MKIKRRCFIYVDAVVMGIITIVKVGYEVACFDCFFFFYETKFHEMRLKFFKL